MTEYNKLAQWMLQGTQICEFFKEHDASGHAQQLEYCLSKFHRLMIDVHGDDYMSAAAEEIANMAQNSLPWPAEKKGDLS